jgi:hypothetical protein
MKLLARPARLRSFRFRAFGASAEYAVTYGSGRTRALESAAIVFVIGVTILFVSFLFGMLNDEWVAFFPQLLVVIASIVWGARTYFVARAKIKNGITPACSGAETAAVIFVAQPSAWRFRFCSRTYAEQFAAVNLGGYLTTL